MQNTALKDRFVRTVQLMFLCASVLLSFGAVAQAAETILEYSSQIIVLENGSVDVTDTIKVRAEGREIRRGIFRDIPTVLANDDGSLLRSNLSVISVHRDGVEEPYHTEGIRDGQRIYVGDADVFLATGEYTYDIRFTMTRMARSFETHDELYWNVTGEFWKFPIKTIAAEVTLPEGANISVLTGYTGEFESQAQDVRWQQTSDNTATFRTTRPFGAGEGLSVVVQFDKGVLLQPNSGQAALNYISDHRTTVFPLLAVFLVLLYNYFAWDSVGRDPKKGTIIPLFHPPEGFSAALSHYVHRMGWKKSGWTAFSAAIVSLATKGLIEITTDKKKTSFSTTNEVARDLPRGEAVLHGFIQSKGTLKVNKSNGTSISANKSKFIAALEEENSKAYFINNAAYVVFGVILALGLLVALVVAETVQPIWVVVGIAAGVGVGIVSSIFGKIGGASNISRFVILVWITVSLFNFVPSVLGRLTTFQLDAGAIAAGSIVALTVIFGFLMRAPTVQGRKIMDKLDGFKMYLETAEKERLNFQGEPEFSVSRFEAILPYAIALGVEKPWANRLEGELARHAIPESESGYHPHWYHGSRLSASNLSRDVSAIGAGIGTAMIASQPVSSSSSGGGGGGFSGGGGGGGGGGGW